VALSQSAIDELAAKGAERGLDVRPGLAAVEQRLGELIQAGSPLLDESSRYLLDAGGKRFRPVLVMLAGALASADPSDDELVDAGAIVELVHLSTLYHDDLIDAAEVRRGQPSAQTKWSNTVAVLTGDFLLARASELSAALGLEVTRVMSATIADLCQGQIREVQGSAVADAHGAVRHRPDREHYLTVIGEKTASLISASCRIGALLSGQSREAVEAMATYGWHLGMSFQLADDVLDIVGEPSESGKTPGTDLREGVYTLPVLLALEEDGPDSRLGLMLAEPSGASADEARALLAEHPALELARDAARLEATKAEQALDSLAVDGTPAREGLSSLADYAAGRVS
jgi:heptaprenyl diphosphate synthase